MFAKPTDLAAFVALVGASCTPTVQPTREEISQECVAAARTAFAENCKKQGIKVNDVANNPEYQRVFDDLLELLRKDNFLSMDRDLPEPGFLLYVDPSGKQGRVVFDYARSAAGMHRHGDFELVDRVQATPDRVGLWEPLSVNRDDISTSQASPDGIRDITEIWSGPIVGRPRAYSRLTELHPRIEIEECEPWEEMK